MNLIKTRTFASESLMGGESFQYEKLARLSTAEGIAVNRTSETEFEDLNDIKYRAA